MKINVSGASVSLRGTLPVFLGTTADRGGGSLFPQKGDVHNYFFKPNKGDTGILVFDQPAEEDRTSDSARLLHFWWQDDKLIVQDRIKERLLNYRVAIFKNLGYAYFPIDRKFVYHTHGDGSALDVPSYKVSIVDLFFFLEGKIEHAELQKRAVNSS